MKQNPRVDVKRFIKTMNKLIANNQKNLDNTSDDMYKVIYSLAIHAFKVAKEELQYNIESKYKGGKI